jgi:hypothetical protein
MEVEKKIEKLAGRVRTQMDEEIKILHNSRSAAFDYESR